MPIEWSELARLRSGAAYTLRSALQKIKRRGADPWKGFAKVRQTLPTLDAASPSAGAKKPRRQARSPANPRRKQK
jgi:bifunctional non-homologous end joining protein LigD